MADWFGFGAVFAFVLLVIALFRGVDAWGDYQDGDDEGMKKHARQTLILVGLAVLSVPLGPLVLVWMVFYALRWLVRAAR